MATDYTKCSIGFAALGNAFDNLTTALSFFGNLLDYMWLRTPLNEDTEMSFGIPNVCNL